MSHSNRVMRRMGASLLGTAIVIALLAPVSAGCGGDDDCLAHGENCSSSYLEREGKTGYSCCEKGEICCELAGGSGVPTCQRAGSCE